MSPEVSSSTWIQLCGALIVEHRGQRLERQLPGRQGRQLFAYLVLNRHRETRRGELVEILWPDQVPAAGDSALSALASKLRGLLGPGALAGRSTLRLSFDDVRVDVESAIEAVHRAESSTATGEWARAWGPALVALFVTQRDFMPSDEAPWIDSWRRHLSEVRVRALEAYAAAALGLGGTELAAAVRAGRQLIEAAPLRESGYRLLMRALARQGNPAEALRVYSVLCDTLREELGVSPSAAARSLHEELLMD